MRSVPFAVGATILLTSFACCVPVGVTAQEIVSFPTRDGGVVFADEYGRGPRAVVLAHGGQFTKESWREQVPAFLEAGFRVLAIDFRGRGRSRAGPGARPGDEDEHLDVLAAVEYLRGAGAESVSVVGASFGGWAAAKAATELPDGAIERLVLLAHSPIENPEDLRGAKLFIVTEGDFRGGGTPRLPDIRDQYERSPEPKSLLVLEGSAHAQHVFATEQGARALEAIVAFLRGDRAGPTFPPPEGWRPVDHLRLRRAGGEDVTEWEGVSGPGDSGGPAFVETDDGLVLVGVSSGRDAGGRGPGRYGAVEYCTRVSAHAGWIDGVLAR